jgi:hypothetical protein
MIEILEPRIAPAGIISLKLVDGLLTAKTLAAGDGEEVLVISQSSMESCAWTRRRARGFSLRGNSWPMEIC